MAEHDEGVRGRQHLSERQGFDSANREGMGSNINNIIAHFKKPLKTKQRQG